MNESLPIDAACLAYLETFLTDERRARIETVMAARTGFVRVVLEDIFQSHNASAAMRSCECFGVQHMHIIENRYAYTPNSEVSMGSAKWVSLHRHRERDTDNTTTALRQLKSEGYRIVAMALREDTIPLEALPVDRPTAFCFGTEEEGLSETAQELADVKVKIPMFGFTQSFNISVTVALALHDFCTRMRAERDDWALPEAERFAIRSAWVRQSLKNPDALIRRFLQDIADSEPGAAIPN
jgi:tRNA (guanosine-2'-O-)-methyltransferase